MELSALSLALTRAGLMSASVPAFSPGDLFTTGVNGAWYDPSDFSTMFQDAAGTTPVTSVGQPVGRILDKSGRGNHAFNPSGNSANFPVLSARYNLLTKTEDFSAAVWVKRGFSAPTYGAVDPLGGTTAWSTTENNTDSNPAVYYSVNFNDTVTRTISVWLKASSNISISLSTQGNISPGTINVTTSWQKFSVTQSISSAGGFGPHIGGFGSIARNSLVTLYIWGADLRVANDALNMPAYQRVNTSTDYDTVGFKPYLLFNGVNQWLQTNSIDFTYGDKMFVSAGVRKLSDGARAIVLELSNSTANNGSFAVDAPGTDAGTVRSYLFSSVGTSIAAAMLNLPASAAPITNVLSGIGNISAPSATLRVNGAQVAQSTATQGTGNYGNYPLYIGARAGTSLFFNGRLYGLVVAGKQASASEVAGTEAWLNQKTGAY